MVVTEELFRSQNRRRMKGEGTWYRTLDRDPSSDYINILNGVNRRERVLGDRTRQTTGYRS